MNDAKAACSIQSKQPNRIGLHATENVLSFFVGKKPRRSVALLPENGLMKRKGVKRRRDNE